VSIVTIGSSIFNCYRFMCLFFVFKETIGCSCNSSSQAIWLKNILVDLGLKQDHSTTTFGENRATISSSYNHVFHGKTNHFKVKLLYLKEKCKKMVDISIIYCKTEDQTADMFRKSFSFRKFEFPRKKVGIGTPQRQGRVLRTCLEIL